MKNIYTKKQADSYFYRLNMAWKRCISVGDNVMFIKNGAGYLGKVTNIWLGNDRRLVVKSFDKTFELRDLSKVCVYNSSFGAYIPVTENYERKTK